MNTRISTARREEEGVANERFLPRVDQVIIFGLGEENEELPLQEPQVPPQPPEPRVPQVPPMPQFTFVEWYMTNAE